MENEEGSKNIYSDIRNVVNRKNGNEVCDALISVLADVIILYCDAQGDRYDVDSVVDYISNHIKEVIIFKRELKEV